MLDPFDYLVKAMSSIIRLFLDPWVDPVLAFATAIATHGDQRHRLSSQGEPY